MDQRTAAIVSLVLVGVGVLLILVGAYMSLGDWKRKREGNVGFAPQDLGGTLSGLAKLLEAMKDYPAGQRMIVFGILLVIIGGLWSGISAL